MKRRWIFLLLVCAAGCQHLPRHEPAVTTGAELQRLTAAQDAAMTQSDMNLASGEISEFWDAKLVAVEKRMEQKLDDEQRKRFSASKKRWRSYRLQEVQFQSGFYEGGSIEPLIANGCYSQITEDRVTELESLWTTALQGAR